MGKINYTLLNASALNASRLNLTGEAGKAGGGGGGYWPDGTPAAIRKSAVLWYDIALQGATNESLAAHPYLLDLTGNGHDMELRNFAYGGMSGVNGYNWNLDTFIVKNFEHTSSAVFLINSEKTTFEDVIVIKFPATLKGQKIKVTSDGSGYSFQLYIQINSSTSVLYKELYTITSDGTYEVKDVDLTQYTDIMNVYYGFRAIKVPEGVTVKVELAPNYPGALVSDGVDDYGLCRGVPVLTNFTVVTKRHLIAHSGTFMTKRKNGGIEDGAFQFERSSNIFVFGKLNRIKFPDGDISWATTTSYNGQALQRGELADSDILGFSTLNGNTYGAGQFALYSFILFDRDLTDEEIEWVKANIMDEAEPEPTPELDASLVDAWIFSGYKNEDAPASVAGEKGHNLNLLNFAFTEGSGFADGCLVTDGVDDYCSCPDFPIKDTYTVIVKFATLNGKQSSAACTMTYFDASGARKNGIFPIYISPGVPYASMFGLKKNVAASSELAEVWMNKEAFCGEAYDDTSGLYTPDEGQRGTVYFGRLDARGFYGGYKFAYWACYDKVMTQEEAEAEIAKLDALWRARKG